jgi:hypothetical protein
LEKGVKQRKNDNFFKKNINLFKFKNKIKLKKADPGRDHTILYNPWISEQKKKGKAFKYRTHGPLPWDIHPIMHK